MIQQMERPFAPVAQSRSRSIHIGVLAAALCALMSSCRTGKLLPMRSSSPSAPTPASAASAQPSLDSAASSRRRPATAPPVGQSVASFRFLTLEQEPLSARAGEGLSSVWLFWPALAQDQPNHAEVQDFRARIDKLLASRGDLSLFEFHHHHLSAQTAPRRDESRHEHLWDPQAVTALRLGLTDFPQAVIVGPDLAVRDLVAFRRGGFSQFYLDIVKALAQVDAQKAQPAASKQGRR